MTDDTEPPAPERPAAVPFDAPSANRAAAHGHGPPAMRPGWFEEPERPGGPEAAKRPAEDPDVPGAADDHARSAADDRLRSAATHRPGWFDEPPRAAPEPAGDAPESAAREPRARRPEPPAPTAAAPGAPDSDGPRPDVREPDVREAGVREADAREPDVREPDVPEPVGNDQLVATLNHGGWGPPPGGEAADPLDPALVDGPQPDRRTDQAGGR